MARVLVTGAAGFIGLPVVKRLAEQGDTVRCLVHGGTEERLPGEVFAAENMKSDNDWVSVVRGVDTVVHLAARAHVLRETSTDPLAAFREANVALTERLARMAAANGVRRFIFLSSIGVHGAVSSTPFTESSPIKPWNAYATSKWEAEQALQRVAAASTLEIAIIRPPLVYGPRVKGNMLTLLRYIDRGVPLPLANVNNQRSLIGLDNLVDLVVRCIASPQSPGTLVAADGEDVSTAEIVQCLARALDRPARLFPVPLSLLTWIAKVSGKEDAVNRLYGSLQINASRAREILPWRPPVSLAEGMERVARWYRKEGRQRA